MRTIKYKRYEFGSDSVDWKGTLLTLVYDIPYFPACGIFPPLHVINQVFSDGGGPGGMSPGAGWKPFTISENEYKELVKAVKDTPISEIESQARYAFIPMEFDCEFDHIEDRFEWMRVICNKHRDKWHQEMRDAGKLA